ncbi:hypothetical protein O1611_g3937 [Lasiodiplodia mahajangana]|uniref:Uncharacterized protein n=1 Tax=Lasiodiplodia mahajangana TaxID=1108764 RepID=A0ACC2JQR3_9PEZI|nr:hypothetical protein O1611_g3937 [Lasiodiplodia mahajangana]
MYPSIKYIAVNIRISAVETSALFTEQCVIENSFKYRGLLSSWKSFHVASKTRKANPIRKQNNYPNEQGKAKTKMAIPSKVTASRQTVSDYNLVRKSTTGQVDILGDMDFMEPYVEYTNKENYRASWVQYRVVKDQRVELATFQISTSVKAYVTEAVFLTFGEQVGAERFTPMRYRDMMVDSYLAAGGDLRTWRYLGYKCILNDATRDLIKECFQRAGLDFTRAGTVELLSGTTEFESAITANPFTRGILGMLRNYERYMGNAQIKKITFISPGYKVAIPLFHLVVELYRPGDDGYPEGPNSLR